jgi:adenylate cyclase
MIYNLLMKLSKTIRKLIIAILSGVFSAAFVLVISDFSSFTKEYFDQLERVLYDITYKFKFIDLEDLVLKNEDKVQEDETAEDRILVADIDEASLFKLGSYHLWPRTHHAKVVEALSLGGASAITFDILFKTADFGEQKTAEALEVFAKANPGVDWEQYSDEIRSHYNYDSVLVASIQKAGNVIVCATVSRSSAYKHKSQWEPISTVEWLNQVSPHSAIPMTHLDTFGIENWELMDNVFPELANAGVYMGLVNVVSDYDGIHRSEPLFHSFPDPRLTPGAIPHIFPIITLQTAIHLFGITPQDIEVKHGEYVNLGKPLAVYKTETGKLMTSFPNLSWNMIQQFIRKKETIQKLVDLKSDNKLIDIASQVLVKRDASGELSADIYEGQELYHNMVELITLNPEFKTAWSQLQSQKVDFEEISFADSESLTLSWSEDDNSALLSDSEADEEVYLNSYTIEVLQDNADLIADLKSGAQIYLSSNLDIKIHPKTKQARSNFIILNRDVIDELLQSDSARFTSLQPGESVRLGREIKIPVDEANRMQINYLGPDNVPPNKQAFKKISYYDLVQDRIDKAAFQGKVFILGSTAPALFDLVSSPVEAEYPGVLIHTTLLENMLNNNFMRKLKKQEMVWIILILAILCAIIANFLPPQVFIPIIALIGAGYFLLNYNYFIEGLYLGLARQEISIIVSLVVVMAIRYFYEEREKRFINSAFKNYISPELIDQMLESSSRPELGGEEGFLTAYFTDIAGFSTFSEKIGSPTRLVELLNEYLTGMTDILIAEGGTLDKYEGDAIIAFFGAPVKLENHAQAACLTALNMQKKLGDLRKIWVSQGDKWPEIVHHMRMRIGINSGLLVTGNMGSSMRMNYTMMGDTVNLAARLESGAKQYGVHTMCSKETLDATKGNLVARMIDKVRVMGKSEPVETYELLGVQGEASPDLIRLVELFAQARILYENMEWNQAIEIYTQCLDLEPYHPDREPGCKTTPSHVYIERCEEYKLNPPQVETGTVWDGVYTATSK